MKVGSASPGDLDRAEAATAPEARGGPTGTPPSPNVETRTSEPSEPRAQPGAPPAVPRVTGGRYEILREHGRGGIGCVYRAHDRELGRDVAIKKLISRGNLVEMRFFREAAITARLEHPGIVPVHEAGWWSDGTPFYAMKLIAGRPLRDLIAERFTVEQRLGLLHHVVAVADAIAYAHARKVIHRDLKPSNVIVGEFGETVVIDWGLAKDLATNESAADGGDPLPAHRDGDLTSAGSVLGTPAYMAPEQRRGEAVDQRADVFAIGMMLWQLCSLEAAPPADPLQRRAVLRRARVDDDLIAIIDKAIAGDPRHRYGDAGALVADLRAFTSGARIAARRYSPLAVVTHWIRRHRVLAISAATCLALLAVLVRTLLHAWVTERVADLGVTQAEVEAGRQALLHEDTAQAQSHLARAYLRGERSPGVAFMLSRALQPRLAEQARLPSAAGRMWPAEFSPDGRQIVTPDETSAQVWDTETHRRLFLLPHGGEVYRAVYTADGARIVTAARGAVRIWDAASGALVRALTPPPGHDTLTYFRLDRSRDGKLVAAIDVNGAIVDVWDASSGTLVAELPNDGWEYPLIAFTGDGRWLATGGGSDVRVFDTRTWARVMTVAGPRIRSMAIDPTAPRLITGSFDGDAAIWAIPSGERVYHLRELGDPVDAVAFAPGGATVATATRDGMIQVWDASSGKLRSTNHQLRTKILSLEFDRTSALVVAGGSSGKVLVEDAASGMPLSVLEGPSNVVWGRFDPSARRVVGASWDGTARIWDAASPYLRWRSPTVNDVCRIVASLEPDRRFVAVGCLGHATHIWDTAHDRLLAELPGTTQVGGGFTSALPAVSAAGDRAAVARDRTVVIYELPGGRPLRTIRHGAAVNAVSFATTGHDLISGAIDGSVLVTRDDGEPVALPGFAAGVDAAGFLSDGRPVAAAGNQLRVYDAERRTVLAELGLPARVHTLRSSSDGRRLVTGPRSIDAPTPAVLWDVEHYQRIGPLAGHVGIVWSARFVRDGREILTSGGDGTVRSWDATSGRLLHTYRGSTRFLTDATLDPEGAMIVAVGGDGLIWFWDAANERPLWTLLGHQPYVIALHFEAGDLVTRGFAGDVARWTFPEPDLDALPELLRELSK
ncbi:MAG TPA: protein kinase [Kofleriaceae bacterium]